MSRQFDIYKKDLTDKEKQYIEERNDLRMLRLEIEEHEDYSEELEEEPDEEAIPVEEFVKQANRQQLMAELDGLGVEYDPKANKPELSKLLVDAVAAQR